MKSPHTRPVVYECAKRVHEPQDVCSLRSANAITITDEKTSCRAKQICAPINTHPTKIAIHSNKNTNLRTTALQEITTE